MYAALVIVGLFLVANLLLNHRKGSPWLEALPPGYGVSLLGVCIFGLGGILDMIWHILFGIEVSVEALAQPHTPHAGTWHRTDSDRSFAFGMASSARQQELWLTALAASGHFYRLTAVVVRLLHEIRTSVQPH